MAGVGGMQRYVSIDVLHNGEMKTPEYNGLAFEYNELVDLGIKRPK